MGTGKSNSFPVVLSIGLVVLLEFLARKLDFSPLLATGLVRIIDISLILLIFNLSSDGIDALGLSPHRFGHGLYRGILWSAIFGIISAVAGIILYLIGINPIKFFRVSIPVNEMILFFIIGGIIGPIAEELVFRGILYGYFRNLLFARLGKRGLVIAGALSTLLFVTAHTAHSQIPMSQIVGGIVFCIAYETEKSLWTPMVIHSTGNMALFVLSLIG